MKQLGVLFLISLLTIACSRGPNPNRSRGFPLDTRPHWMIYHSTHEYGAFNIWIYDLELDSTWALTTDTLWHYNPIRWSDSTLSIMGPRDIGTIRLEKNLRSVNTAPLLPGVYPKEMLWPSPNGLMLAGQASVNDTTQVFVSRIDGKRLQWLTSGSAGGTEPQWSPDGLTLLYRSNQDGNPELYLFQLTTAHQLRLTQHDSLDRYGVWHPNGRKIAFASNRHRSEMDLYLLDVATGDTRRLTHNDWGKGELSFSPDGRFLAFHAKPPNGYFDMYLYDMKADSIKRVTQTEAYDGYPTWIVKPSTR